MPYSNYPQSATNAAKKALKHKEENGSQCGTSVGWTRARQLSSREALSEDEVIRTYSFLSRAKVYDQGKYFDEDGKELCGSIMYDAWGGSSMLPWAESRAKKIMDERSKENNMEKRSINFELRAKPESRLGEEKGKRRGSSRATAASRREAAKASRSRGSVPRADQGRCQIHDGKDRRIRPGGSWPDPHPRCVSRGMLGQASQHAGASGNGPRSGNEAVGEAGVGCDW